MWQVPMQRGLQALVPRVWQSPHPGRVVESGSPNQIHFCFNWGRQSKRKPSAKQNRGKDELSSFKNWERRREA